MKTRILTALISLPLLLAVLIFPYPWLLTLVVTVLTLVGLWEMSHCLDLYEKTPLTVLSALMGLSFPLLAWLKPELIWGLIIFYTIKILCLSVVYHKTLPLDVIAKSYLSTLYVAGLFSTIITVRMAPEGRLLLWLIFIAAFATDTFAYFTGCFLGKHKLCPEVSPKKTVEGAIGGVLGCVLCFGIYALVVSKSVVVNLPSLLTLAVVVSVASQFGDLSASIIKRQFGIKDYGRLFPGHGGVLDRFDSVLFTAPTIAIWSQVWPIIWVLFG